MNHDEFLTQVIDKGIAAARRDYNRPDQERKLAGSIAGFSACRGLTIDELASLLEAARGATQHARQQDDRKDYWWFRCFELEVEWTCNCLSCVLMNEGLPTIIPPTARAMMTTAEVVGVREST